MGMRTSEKRICIPVESGPMRVPGAGLCEVVVSILAVFAWAQFLCSPVRAQVGACVGDCDGDEAVSVNELITGVNIALGNQPVENCSAFDADESGNVAVNELIMGVSNALNGCGVVPPTATPTEEEGTPTPTATPPAGNPLGERVFSIKGATGTEEGSALLSSALDNLGVPFPNGAMNFSDTDLRLVAGSPDADGKAPLQLVEDALIGVQALDASIVCFKVFAAESDGWVDCDGGSAADVTLTQESGEDAAPPVLTVADGETTGAGAVFLRATYATGQLPSGSSLEDCPGAPFDPPVEIAFTTGNATGIKGAQILSWDGENLSCDDWTTENGVGKLVTPLVGFDVRAGGDVANVLFLVD